MRAHKIKGFQRAPVDPTILKGIEPISKYINILLNSKEVFGNSYHLQGLRRARDETLHRDPFHVQSTCVGFRGYVYEEASSASRYLWGLGMLIYWVPLYMQETSLRCSYCLLLDPNITREAHSEPSRPLCKSFFYLQKAPEIQQTTAGISSPSRFRFIKGSNQSKLSRRSPGHTLML